MWWCNDSVLLSDTCWKYWQISLCCMLQCLGVLVLFLVYFLHNMCLKLWSYCPLWPMLDYHTNMCKYIHIYIYMADQTHSLTWNLIQDRSRVLSCLMLQALADVNALIRTLRSDWDQRFHICRTLSSITLTHTHVSHSKCHVFITRATVQHFRVTLKEYVVFVYICMHMYI